MGSNTGGLGPATLNAMSEDGWPAPVEETLNAGIGNVSLQITSNDQLVRADNTEWAWNGTNWTPAPFVDSSLRYFAGHFGAPGSPSDPQFGDNLLGALAYDGSSAGPPTITLTFSTVLQYVGFQVSSAHDANFTAQLLAFDSLGHQIGTYQVVSTGAGGMCAGLAMTPPQPCKDAPLIQFYDPNQTIASVELVMLSDTSGVFIDSLELAPVPEPYSLAYVGGGLGLLLFLRRRRLYQVQ